MALLRKDTFDFKISRQNLYLKPPWRQIFDEKQKRFLVLKMIFSGKKESLVETQTKKIKVVVTKRDIGVQHAGKLQHTYFTLTDPETWKWVQVVYSQSSKWKLSLMACGEWHFGAPIRFRIAYVRTSHHYGIGAFIRSDTEEISMWEYEPGRAPLSGIESVGTLILDCPGSKLRTKLWHSRLPVHRILLQHPELTKTYCIVTTTAVQTAFRVLLADNVYPFN